MSSARPAQAVVERIYTLPFYADYSITPEGCFHCYYDPVYGWHEGTDYVLGASQAGEVVAAAAAGTAKNCGFSSSAGNFLVIDHGNGHRTRYLHFNSSALPGNGQSVARGEIIGYEGSTGYTVPPGFVHLHFEIRHGATTFTCGKDGTAVDPYASNTYMWEDQPPGGQPPNHADFSPAVASYYSSRVDIFVRGENNDLYQKTRTGGSWGGWTRPHAGDCLRSAPAAATRAANRIDVFYRGCENDLWWTSWNGSSWSTDVPIPGQACLLSAPAAASWGTNRIDVFYRGCENDLWWTYWNGYGWSIDTTPWPGTCMRSPPAAVSWGANRIDIFYRGCNDSVWHQWYISGAWYREDLGGCTMLAPAVASYASNRLDVFYRGCEYGPSGAGVFHRSWNGSSWSGEVGRGGCLASGPGTDAWAPEWRVAHYRGCDSPGNMYKLFNNGGSWSEIGFANWPP